LQTFRLQGRRMRTGFLLLPLHLLPVTEELHNEDEGKDHMFTNGMAAAINRWLNSKEFLEKLQSLLSRAPGERRVCKVVSSGHGTNLCLRNNGETIPKGTWMNLYTGFIINSCEDEVERLSVADGVADNRKLQVKVKITNKRGVIKHNWIQLGWRLDEKSTLFANVNDEVGGGAEFCDHSCDPNCDFFDLDPPIHGELKADGQSFTVDITPNILVSSREIKPGDFLSVDYGTNSVVKGGPSVKKYNDFKKKFGDLERNAQKKNAGKIFPRGTCLLPQKELEERHKNGEFGFDCKCKFCDDLHFLIDRPRSRLFMCDDTRIDYEALRNIFGLPLNVNASGHELAPRPRQPDSYMDSLLVSEGDIKNRLAAKRRRERAEKSRQKKLNLQSNVEPLGNIRPQGGGEPLGNVGPQGGGEPLGNVGPQGESQGKGPGRKPQGKSRNKRQGRKPHDEGGYEEDGGEK
jgi:hypothetical protein